MPLLALFAVIAAGLFAFAAMPRNKQHTERRSEHLRAFLGTRRGAEPVAESAPVEKEEETRPSWRGVDLSIFED